jgi:hypothetical protein
LTRILILIIIFNMRLLLSFILTCLLPATSKAQMLLTPPDAIKQVFGQDCQYHPNFIVLPPWAAEALANRLHVSHVTPGFQFFAVTSGGEPKGWALLDEEMGKHQAISLMIGLDTKARIRGIRILVYREAYGGGVSGEKFTHQFEGKGVKDRLQVGKDVDAVSGATISSKAVALGARKAILTARYAFLKEAF